VTQHNIVFQAKLMGQVRDAILKDAYPAFLKDFFKGYYADGKYPRWIVDALNSVGVDLLEGVPNAEVTNTDGANWDYA